MLSDIFIGTPANEDSDAIRNQQAEDYAEDMFTGSADAIRNREPHVLKLDKDFEKSILEMHLRQTQYFQFISLVGVHLRKYSFYHQTLMD